MLDSELNRISVSGEVRRLQQISAWELIRNQQVIGSSPIVGSIFFVAALQTA